MSTLNNHWGGGRGEGGRRGGGRWMSGGCLTLIHLVGLAYSAWQIHKNLRSCTTWVAQIEFTDAVTKSLHRLQPRQQSWLWRSTGRQRSLRVTAWATLLCKCFPPSPFYLSAVLNTSNYTELLAKHLTNPLLSSQDRFWLIRIKRQKRPLCKTGGNHMLKRLFIQTKLDTTQRKNMHKHAKAEEAVELAS